MKQFSKRWLVLLLLMGALLLSLTGCAGWTGSVIWTMCIFFFWMIYIWMFITVFADIFRRHDIGGGKKAIWIIFIIFIPLIGIIVYMIARPKHLAQDAQTMERAQAAQHPGAPYSEADEIAKAQALLNSGAITQAEFEEMKRKALS
jgi:Short C-terminal domain/Phospholipase_D-nuclease N-terminal